MEYLRIFGTENTAGGSSTWPRGWRARPTPWARPLPRGSTVALLHLFLHPSSSCVSHKHEKPTQARVPAPVAVIFDLLAQSTSPKTAWGDCSLVCDPSIGPISFCSSALFIANLCCIGDHVLELACQILWFQVVLMLDIGSRHLLELLLSILLKLVHFYLKLLKISDCFRK